MNKTEYEAYLDSSEEWGQSSSVSFTNRSRRTNNLSSEQTEECTVGTQYYEEGQPSVEKVIALARGTEPTPVITDNSSTEKMCRICHGGTEDEESLGRLISPCHCKGTMRYVHVECLNIWRLKSQKKTSFFQCDECKYQYAFHRTKIAKYANNELVLTLVTLILFAFCVFIGGFLAKLFLYLNEYPLSIYLGSSEEADQPQEVPPIEPITMVSVFTVDYKHLIFGFIFVGIIGFIQFLFSVLWFGPFPSWSIRLPSGGGGGGGGSTRGDSVAIIFFTIILIVGVIKAVWGMYKLVRGVSRMILERVELVILEVNERGLVG